jgi:Glycosyl hydrolase-like 10
VKFGVSPFGLGKPDRRPPGISGFSQYDKLYADAELWLNRGWLDYFTPQLYWPIDQRAQAFDVLLDYWVRENTQRRHLWPGIYTSRINDTAQSWQPQEIANQIGVMRSRADANEMRRGHVHFSMVALKQNRKGVNDALKDAYYRDAALIPATPWLSRTAPGSPTVAFAGNKVQLQSNARDAVTQYAVWTRVNNIWKFSSVPATTNGITFAEFTLDQNGGADRITAAVVSAVDRLGNESERIHTVNGAQVNLTR